MYFRKNVFAFLWYGRGLGFGWKGERWGHLDVLVLPIEQT
jgi:hypothetical protein